MLFYLQIKLKKAAQAAAGILIKWSRILIYQLTGRHCVLYTHNYSSYIVKVKVCFAAMDSADAHLGPGIYIAIVGFMCCTTSFKSAFSLEPKFHGLLEWVYFVLSTWNAEVTIKVWLFLFVKLVFYLQMRLGLILSKGWPSIRDIKLIFSLSISMERTLRWWRRSWRTTKSLKI